MEEQQHNIDEIFRESLGDYREAPPAAAWDDIQRRLDSDIIHPRGFSSRWPWISLFLLVVVGGTWYGVAKYNHRKSDEKKIIPIKNSVQNNSVQNSSPNTEVLQPSPVTMDSLYNSSSSANSVSTATRENGTQQFSDKSKTSSIADKIQSDLSSRTNSTKKINGGTTTLHSLNKWTDHSIFSKPAAPITADIHPPAIQPKQAIVPAAKEIYKDNALPSDDTTNDDTTNKEESGNSHTPKRKQKLSFPFSGTVLAGYEWGFQQPAPGRGVAALRFLWHFNSSFSLGIQPAYRSGNVATQAITGQQAFSNTTAYPISVDSFYTIIPGTTTKLFHYNIHQAYDSIVVPATTAGGTFSELELPLLLSYEPAGSNWHFYAGPSFNFGGKLSSTTIGTAQTYTRLHIDSFQTTQELPSDTFSHYFSSTLPPYSSYNPDGAKLKDPSSLRLGYTLGLGYQWRGLMLDISLHQQLSGYSNVNPSLQKAYSSPCFRLSLGYRVFSPKQANKSAAPK